MNPNLIIGQTFDRYRITQILGQGGMAEVYLAEDVELKRPVVLKIMLPRLAQDADFVARFRREAQATARLNHPNIVQVYTTGTAPDGRLYIALQYIDGGTLSQYLYQLAQKRQWIPIPYALSIVRQMASSLEVAHGAGIVHRDIKPSNILLRKDGTAVLADLGIAAMQSEATRLTQTGFMPGTPQYMSPEQGTSKDVDGRSDIYSLGIILYELLGGRLPFESESPWGLIHQHIHEPVPPLRNIRAGLSEETYRLVETCLQKAPEDRYPTGGALMAALDHAAAVERGEAKTAGQLDATLKQAPSASGLWRWAGGGVLLVTLGLLLGWGGLALFGGGSGGEETAVVVALPSPTEAGEVREEAGGETAVVADPTETADPTLTSTAKPTATIASSPTATGTPTPAPTATPTPILPKVNNFEVCLEECNGSNGVSRFPEKTAQIYAAWEFENIPIGSQYVRSWSNNGEEWVRYECEWEGPVSGVDRVRLSEPSGVRSGLWEVIISVDNVVVMKKEFLVEGTWGFWVSPGTFDGCFDN